MWADYKNFFTSQNTMEQKSRQIVITAVQFGTLMIQLIKINNHHYGLSVV